MSLFNELTVAISSARPSRSLLLYATIITGFVLCGFKPTEASIRALPVLLIALSGFCINDIIDQESDRINHPERALAEFSSLTPAAMLLYVILFLLSLLCIQIQGDALIKFTWAIVLLLISNYSFLKRALPFAKDAYVGVAACFTLSVIDFSQDQRLSPLVMYAPLFISVFARELACDVADIRGDAATIASRLGQTRSAHLVHCLYFSALILALFLARSTEHVLAAIAGLFALTAYIYAKTEGHKENSLYLLSGATMIAPAILVIN